MSGARRQPPPAAPMLRLVLCPEPPTATAGGGGGPMPAAMRAFIRDICAQLAGQAPASHSAAPWVPAPAELAVLAASPAQAACIRRALADAGVGIAAEHLQPDPSCPDGGGSAAAAPAAAAGAVACLMAAMLHGGGGQTAARLLASPLLALSAARAHALTCDAEAMDRLCGDLHQAADLWQRCGLLPAYRLFMRRSGAEARLMRSRGGRQVLKACLDLCRHLQGGHGSWGGPAGQYRALRRLCAGPPDGGADAAVSPGGGMQEARVCIVTPAAARSRRWQQVFMTCPAPAACRVQAAADAASPAAVPRPGDGRQGQDMALGPLLQAARACAGSACCIYAALPPAADQAPGPDPAVPGAGAATAVAGLPRGVRLPPALAEFAAAHRGALEISLQDGEQPRWGAGAADPPGAAWDTGGVSHTCRSLACWLQRCSHPAAPDAPAACTAAAPAEASGGVQAGVISRFDFPDTPAGEAFLLRMLRGVHWPSCRSTDHLSAVVAAALEERGAQPSALQDWGGGEAQARSRVLTAWLHDIVRARLRQLPITGGQCLADLAERDFVSDMRFCLSIPQLEPGALCDLCRSCDLALARSAGVPLHAAWLQGLRPVPMAAAAPRGWVRGTLELVVRLNGGHGPRYFVINAMSPCLGHHATDYAAPRMLEDLLCPRRRGDLLLMLQTLVLYRHLCLRHGPLSGPSRRALYEDQVGGVLHLYLRGLVAGQGDSGILCTRMDFDTLQEFDGLCTAGERRT